MQVLGDALLPPYSMIQVSPLPPGFEGVGKAARSVVGGGGGEGDSEGKHVPGVQATPPVHVALKHRSGQQPRASPATSSQ